VSQRSRARRVEAMSGEGASAGEALCERGTHKRDKKTHEGIVKTKNAWATEEELRKA